jgi:hypothetical protein
MKNELRQIAIRKDYLSGIVFFVWEDTKEVLTEDEYKDVIESYNLLLTQRDAEETFKGFTLRA